MIEIGPGADLYRALGVLYWIAALAALVAALRLPRTPKRKAIAAGIVVLVFGYGPIQVIREDRAKRAALDAAWAHYQMRCQSAGEKIYRTVDNVEGIFLLKVRPEKINFSDQFALDDPYGRDCGGDACIMQLLYGRNQQGHLVERNPVKPGYRYVDVIDPMNGRRYRYVAYLGLPPDLKGRSEPMLLLRREPAPDPPPRYGVTYEDISTREDREVWVAGGSLKVIDLQANEVIAERIGYMIDLGQGDLSGFRSPWAYAAWNACPPFPEAKGGGPFRSHRTRDFVEEVVKIKQGE